MPDIELLHKEYESRRRSGRLAAWISGLLVLAVGYSFAGFLPGNETAEDGSHQAPSPGILSTFLSAISIPKDTLYTVQDQILEIDLDRQTLYRRYRDNRCDSFKVSTGNPSLNKGIETRTGIFLIQNKIEWLYSLQFDSTKVFNWMGFNFGIGFHSLEGTRYYWNLGKRASSHGCVRLSTEDAKLLFSTVPLGTPVFVHKGSFARVAAFCPSDLDIDSASFSMREVRSFYVQRLEDLYRGRRLLRNHPNIPLMKKYVGHSGVPIGYAESVPKRQRVPSPSYEFCSLPPLYPFPREHRLPRWNNTHQAREKETFEQNILP